MTWRFRYPVTTLIGGTLVLAGVACSNTRTSGDSAKVADSGRALTQQQRRQTRDLHTAAVRSGVERGIPESTAEFLWVSNFKMGLISPLADDEQRFELTSGLYGPLVSAFPDDNLGNYGSVDAFETTRLVALVTLADNVPGNEPGYASLNINQAGKYCVFLKHTGHSDRDWLASTVKTNTPCDQVSTPTTLPIKAHAERSSFDNDTWDRPDDYPAAVRFVEGTAKAMFLGVRCGNRLCIIGTDRRNQVEKPAHSRGTGRPMRNVRVWHDDQRLAAGSSLNDMRPTMRAAIIPDSNLARKSLSVLQSPGHQPVAVIEISGPVPPKYRKAYGFITGTNTIYMHLDDATKGNALIVNASGVQVRKVTREDHTDQVLDLPATARWRWKDTDEEIWVRCDVGCCMIEPEVVTKAP